jgi:hypothetical protein
VRFLPGHDQWVMGPGTKDTRVTPATQRQAVTRKANPVIVGGVVRGTWAVKRDDVTVTWLDRSGAAPREEIEEECARLAAVLGRELRPSLEA